jgi:DNA polymerase-3 subunit delta
MAKKQEDNTTRYLQILNDLKKKNFNTVYFFCGEEPYYINKLSQYIENYVLDETERAFNLSVLYGPDTNASQIVAEAKRFPMMAERTVVLVKEAQTIKDLEKIEPYILSPSPTTLLAICYKYGTPDARKSFGKTVKNKTVYFESSKLYDNQLPNWINQLIAEKGYKINPSASQLLADSLGNDLDKIENELNKIFINITPQTEITTGIIQQYIGISKDFNVFELQRALGNKDVYKVYQIINYFASNPKEHPFVILPGTLFNYFVKIMLTHKITDKTKLASALGVSPYFVKEYIDAARLYSPTKLVQIISILREYDLKSKGVDAGLATDADLMKEMMYKILH